jgi:cysteine desulfurase
MPIYLDHHATTPVDPRVLDAMLPYLREDFGNPSSAHSFGWKAREAVEAARKLVAGLIGALPAEIIFTSGATEANNIAILGSVARAGPKAHVITSSIEHAAVLDPVRRLEKEGHAITVLSPDRDGFVSPERVRESLREDTFLVTLQAAQNEVGSIQPIAAIGAICREAGVLFHSDAAQAAGKIPLDVERGSVDLLSISGHKFYGPKGIGALFVRRRARQVPVRLAPLLLGGGQENGIRPGTLNVPGIVGLGAAARLVVEELGAEAPRIAALRNRLWESLRRAVPDLQLNGPTDFSQRLPGNLSVSVPDADGTRLLLGLTDVAASSGSACASGRGEPSSVLLALGMRAELAAATLRLCVGRHQTEEDIDRAAESIVNAMRGARVVARR